jgi:hypothetical protein
MYIAFATSDGYTLCILPSQLPADIHSVDRLHNSRQIYTVYIAFATPDRYTLCRSLFATPCKKSGYAGGYFISYAFHFLHIEIQVQTRQQRSRSQAAPFRVQPPATLTG